MFLYNVTIIIEEEAAEEWLKYMNEFHIPEVMATGKFISNRLLKIIDSPNEGVTYCSQFVLENLAEYEDYQQNYATKLQADLQQKFENKFVSFRSLMEFIA